MQLSCAGVGGSELAIVGNRRKAQCGRGVAYIGPSLLIWLKFKGLLPEVFLVLCYVSIAQTSAHKLSWCKFPNKAQTSSDFATEFLVG